MDINTNIKEVVIHECELIDFISDFFDGSINIPKNSKIKTCYYVNDKLKVSIITKEK